MSQPFTTIYNEDALIVALKAGNQKAFEELYDRFAPNLLGVLLRLVHDQAQAEDLLQDSFVKIWRNLALYEPAKGRLFTWMLVIVRHAAFKYLEKPKHNYRSIDGVPLESIGGFTPTYTSIGLIQWVNATLAPNERMVIHLLYFQGYTYQEISDEFRLPLGTVKTFVRRGLQQLRASEVRLA